MRASILKVDHIVTDIHEIEEEQTSGRQIKLLGGGGRETLKALNLKDEPSLQCCKD